MGIWFFFACAISLLGMWRVRRLNPTNADSAVCAQCRYNLAGLPPDVVCPECGGQTREQQDVRARLVIRPAFERLPFIWTVFIVVPFLWTIGSLLGAPAVFAPAGGHGAGWQSASGGQAGASASVSGLIADAAPCAACIAFASMVWPRRTRWIVGGGLLLLFVAQVFGFYLPTEEGLLQWDAPITTFLYLAGVSASLRAAVLYIRSSIIQRRWSLIVDRP